MCSTATSEAAALESRRANLQAATHSANRGFMMVKMWIYNDHTGASSKIEYVIVSRYTCGACSGLMYNALAGTLW